MFSLVLGDAVRDRDRMALQTCPDCQGKVSSEASACPHCGRPVEQLWSIRSPDGEVIEKVRAHELRALVKSGKADAQWSVQRGGEEWRPATEVFADAANPPLSAPGPQPQKTEDAVDVASRWTRGLLIACVFAIGGYCLGRWYPLFSDAITRNLCQPDSPCREQSAQGYLLGGTILGVALAMINDLALRMQSKG